MKWKNDIGALARKSATAGTALALLLFALSGALLKASNTDDKKSNATGFLANAMPLMLAVAGLLLGWWAFTRFSNSIRRLINIEETPGIAALARFGVPIVVARTIHDEIQHASRELSLGYFSTLILTPNWLVYTTVQNVAAYKYIEFHSMQLSFMVQDPKIAWAVVLEGKGWSMEVEGPHDKCLLIVREIKSRYPSIKVSDP